MLVGLVMCVVATQAAGKYVDVRDPAVRGRVVASFRERGPEGLNVALGFYDDLRKEYRRLKKEMQRHEMQHTPTYKVSLPKVTNEASPQDRLAATRQKLADATAHLEAWRAAIDQIGGQRGCAVSRLFWYTDLDAAQAAAQQTGRPILSLRMLGNLTDEFSCANSRFFRTALYTNEEISNYLRDHFVLHWKSVRPVPRVTIDFGDGRKLERTLTGNSAHYVLTSEGQPLDVLPGLYSPSAFRAWLERMHGFHAEYVATTPEEQAAQLANFHRKRRAQVYRGWVSDVQRLGADHAALVTSRIDGAIESARVTGGESPLAVAAARLAETNSAAETPLLRYANFSGPWIETGANDELWQAIAKLHREEVRLDEASVGVMRREFPNAAAAGQLAVSKRRQEDPLLRIVRVFEDSMALDTVRNEYLLHRRVHEQFAETDHVTGDIDTLNEWVYAELFLTPSSDPWLGLAPPDVYTALDNDGRRGAVSQIASRPRE
jgi:hypothetical protein